MHASGSRAMIIDMCITHMHQGQGSRNIYASYIYIYRVVFSTASGALVVGGVRDICMYIPSHPIPSHPIPSHPIPGDSITKEWSLVSSSYNHCPVHQLMCYRGVFSNVPNSRAVVTLFDSGRLLRFWWYSITKVWSVHHIIIVLSINGVCYIGGLQICPKFGCSGHTFWRWLVTVDFDDVSLQKYGQSSYEVYD